MKYFEPQNIRVSTMLSTRDSLHISVFGMNSIIVYFTKRVTLEDGKHTPAPPSTLNTHFEVLTFLCTSRKLEWWRRWKQGVSTQVVVDDQKGLTSLPAAMSTSGSIRLRGGAHNSCKRAAGWSSPYAAAVRASRSSSLPPLSRSCGGHGRRWCFLFVKGILKGGCFVCDHSLFLFFSFSSLLGYGFFFPSTGFGVLCWSTGNKTLMLDAKATRIEALCPRKQRKTPKKANKKRAFLTWMMRSVCVFPSRILRSTFAPASFRALAKRTLWGSWGGQRAGIRIDEKKRMMEKLSEWLCMPRVTYTFCLSPYVRWRSSFQNFSTSQISVMTAVGTYGTFLGVSPRMRTLRWRGRICPPPRARGGWGGGGRRSYGTYFSELSVLGSRSESCVCPPSYLTPPPPHTHTHTHKAYAMFNTGVRTRVFFLV